ncbi:MAG: protein kinase [Kribbellaceae bacterium]|nr:protein kinase [Kribbellaceae bacterium]
MLGQQLAEGLAAIHAAGLIHGGLTPGAVVMLSDGRPQLSALTLGLSQHTGHAALNSPSQLYIAPETLRDGTLTASSDLYALGAVLYSAISGKPPLAARMGETAGEHILRVLNEPPARLDVLPDSFAGLIARLLEKDPAKRPGSAAEVAAALTALAASATPIPPARPVPTVTKAAPAMPLRPRPTVLKRKDLPSWPQATNPTPSAPSSQTPPPPPPAAQPSRQSVAPPVAPPPVAAPPTQQTPATPTQPSPPKRRNRLLVAGGVVLASALVTTFALVNRKDQPQDPPISAPTPTQSTPALVVTLNPPADHSTYVELTWSGPSDVNYAVVVAQPGKQAETTLVYKRTKYRVAVVPGVPYCFAIQATDGINPAQSQTRPIRDAQCEGR